MAKKKETPIMDEPIEAIEEAEETAEKVEKEPVKESEPLIADEPKGDSFVERTLKAINKMENPVKAERLANRLLRKRR